MSACVYECVPCLCECPWVSEEGVRSPEDGVTYGCELPNLGVGDWN